MPVNDFACPECDFVIADQYHPSYLARPVCPKDHILMERLWSMSAGKPFEPFEVDLGDGPVQIGSLGDVRRIERESEKRYRNGDGAPFVFRAYSQDPSNRDVNVFGPGPQKPHPRASKAGVPFIQRQK